MVEEGETSDTALEERETTDTAGGKARQQTLLMKLLCDEFALHVYFLNKIELKYSEKYK